jgi:hypothetical protein
MLPDRFRLATIFPGTEHAILAIPSTAAQAAGIDCKQWRIAMERVLILLKRKPGLSFDAFRTHYEGSHAKLGEKYFGHLFASYRRNYIPSGMRLADHNMVEPAYDCVTELVFREPGGYAELKRIASDPEVREILIADEERFLDRTACHNALSEPIESHLG